MTESDQPKTPLRVRHLKPGQLFALRRTGDCYEFVCRNHESPKGTQYVVRRAGDNTNSTLHHACHVELL